MPLCMMQSMCKWLSWSFVTMCDNVKVVMCSSENKLRNYVASSSLLTSLLRFGWSGFGPTTFSLTECAHAHFEYM